MKRPLVLATAILAAAAVWIGLAERRIESLEARQRVLGEADDSQPLWQASDAGSRAAHERRTPRRFDDLFALTRLEDSDLRRAEILKVLAEMSDSEIQRLIAQAREATSLENEPRMQLLGLAVLMLADSSPRVALDVANALDQRFQAEDPDNSERFNLSMGIHAALANWAAEDPAGALQWAKEAAKHDPDLDFDRTLGSIIGGAATNDPAYAFDLLKLADPEKAWLSAQAIANSSFTAKHRTAALAGLRAYLAEAPDAAAAAEVERTFLENIGGRLSAFSLEEQRFEEAVAWIEENLTQREKAVLAEGIGGSSIRRGGAGWFGWLAETLPADDFESHVRRAVGLWTRQDFRAVEEWLEQAPEDAAKVPAVKGYVETMARYRPIDAERRALVLPPDEQRAALEIIHDRWPDEDPEGRAAFAARHGLE